MSITVIAHVCLGRPSPFPQELTDLEIQAEGSFHPHELGGGVLVVSFDTDHADLVRGAFERHLESHHLTALALHRHGEREFFFSSTNPSIL